MGTGMHFETGLHETSPSYLSGAGYWITPHNVCFRLQGRHIEAVCANPAGFGINQEQLQELFRVYNEGYGIEANARVQVIKALVLARWIRVRHYAVRRGWCMNLPDDTPVTVARAAAFLIDVQKAGAYDDNLNLDSRAGRRRTIISDFVRSVLEEHDVQDLPRMAWIPGEAHLNTDTAPQVCLQFPTQTHPETSETS